MSSLTSAFSEYLEQWQHWLDHGLTLQADHTPSPLPEYPQSDVLVFAPHPDDEVLMSALALRFLAQQKRVTAIAVTLGSKLERRQARWHEMTQACRHLGFAQLTIAAEQIALQTREQHRQYWQTCVNDITDLIQQQQPRWLFVPHAQDHHPTHIGVHWLVKDALEQCQFTGYVALTEYWQPLAQPNLLLEVSQTEAAQMMEALMLHQGEVSRNPYHLSLPSWLHDNVRRGSELVSGHGCAQVPFRFGCLYQVQHWQNGVARTLPPCVLSHQQALPTEWLV